MDGFALSLAVVSGICFGTGVFHLFIGLRRRGADMKHLTFGLFAVAYAAAVLTGLLMYRATTLPQHLAVDRWSGVFAAVTYIFLIWFVAIYTDVQPLPVLGMLTVLFATLLTAHATRPTLIHGEILGLAIVTLPWGEQITFLEAGESTWELVFLVTQLLTITFLFYACVRQYLRGERGAARALGAGLLFFVATIVFDIFVESGLIDFVLASDFGFLGLALVMGLRISGDVIRTEEELAGYRRHLETMVEERTTALHRRAEELALLNHIAQTIASVTALPEAMAQVSELVTDLFGVPYAYIILPSAKEPTPQLLVGFDRRSGPVGATPLPVPLTELEFFDRVLIHAESLTLSDVQSLPIAAPMRDVVTSQEIHNAMLTPLVVRGAAIGLLAVATDQADRVFSPDQVRLAETVAADIAGAIENARLFEQAQEAAAAEERSRLARDLHDAVTQTIYSATLIAESLPQVWARNPAEGERNLAKLRQLARGALAEMRTLLFELRPWALEAAEPDTLLQYLGNALTGRTRIPVEVTIEGEAELPVDVKVALYRITQEAFNNIAKHAQATQVDVTLRRGPDQAILTLQDNGRGFEPDSVPAEHMGLNIMRERAKTIGAELTIESSPARGTQVVVVWPADDRRQTMDDGRTATDD